MNYYIKQRVFSFRDAFDIMMANGDVCFTVKQEMFTFGDKLHFYNNFDEEIIFIEKKLFKFLPEYNIYFNDRLAATVKKEMSFFKPQFSIYSDLGDFTMNGDFFAHDFSIFNKGMEVAYFHKKYISLGDTYEISIKNDNEYAPFLLALVIIIDRIYHENNRN